MFFYPVLYQLKPDSLKYQNFPKWSRVRLRLTVCQRLIVLQTVTGQGFVPL